MNRGISSLYEMSISTFQKNLTPSPIVHELLKHQSRYHHHVLTAYKISGYPSSSGKKKAVDVLISIETVEKVQLLLFIKIHI